MRIGELSERTGVSRRLLRYYEAQNLIQPNRSDNGYRDYDPRLVDRVAQIRGLLDAGMPTRVIAMILPCLDVPGVLVCADDASADVVEALVRERDVMTDRIATLTRNRDALTDYLAAVTDGGM